MIKAIVGANLVYPDRIEPGTVLIEDGVILAAGVVGVPAAAEVIDAKDLYLGPGFIDIHCHGGGDALGHIDPRTASRYHLLHGTTSLLLSLAYNLSKDDFRNGIKLIRQTIDQGETNLIGIHFEGPYTNRKYGAKSDLAWDLNRDDYVQLFDDAEGIVYQCTYAPEREGIGEFARYAAARGVKLAAGHTEMSPDILEEAVADGVTIITHLFDAMGCHLGPDSIKVTGIVQDTAADAALSRDDLYVEIICDSRAVHVKPANLRLALKAAGADRVVLITDATVRPHNPADYDTSDYRSALDLNFNERGQLSGSRLTMDKALLNMQKYTGASLVDLFKMSSLNPARAIGIDDQVGSLETGKLANFVLLDEDLRLVDVYLRGERVIEGE